MNKHKYYFILVNDIVKDYSLQYDVAFKIAKGYKNANSLSSVQILETISTELYDVT